MGKGTAQKINKSRAIRRLVIWYKRNSAVTSIVDTAASSAVTASNVAGIVVSSASSVVSQLVMSRVMLRVIWFLVLVLL